MRYRSPGLSLFWTSLARLGIISIAIRRRFWWAALILITEAASSPLPSLPCLVPIATSAHADLPYPFPAASEPDQGYDNGYIAADKAESGGRLSQIA